MTTIKKLIIATALMGSLGMQGMMPYAIDSDTEEEIEEDAIAGQNLLQVQESVGQRQGCFQRLWGLMPSKRTLCTFKSANKRLSQAMLGKGDIDAVHQALSDGADVNQVNKYGCTTLISAAANGKAALVSTLIAAGADVNQGDGHGRTPLMYASNYGHAETVTMLIEFDADVNMVDRWGIAPLRSAAHHSHTETVKILVFHGAIPCGKEPEAMKEVIEQAQEARRNVGNQDWLANELLASKALDFVPMQAGQVGQHVAPSDRVRFYPFLKH